MTLFETILSDDIIRPVGWTLVHFLWQATIAAAILWGLLQLFAKASSNVRYAIACVALLVMVIMPAVTFCVLYEPPVAVATVEPVVIEPPAEATVTVSAEPIAIEAEPFVLPPRPLKAVVAEKIEAALPACVLGWFIGVAALSLWYLGGWCQLQKLRRIGTKTVSQAVSAKASDLANRLGIHRGVQIVESALVQVPTVIGALKPIVLLPATALTGLDEVQLSALIAHELAHVKRCDYLVNILQTIVEILGFYHPALWWISRQIRLERENCCDDMAVALLQNKKDYAGALFTMETIRSKQLELAVAANGGSLTDRITRLADKEAKHPKSGWIPSVVTILLASALLITTAMAISNEVKKDKTPTKQEMAMFFVEAWQALESGNDKNIDNYFYFENDTIRQKALPYLKPELGDFSDIDNVHILDISMSSDGAYQVFTLNPVSSTVKTYLIFRRLIVYEDGRYKLKMCTQEWFDQRMIISGSESEKEAVRKIAEDKINEWKAAAGDALDALVQSRIQEYERALTAIQYAKVHNLKLVPLNAEEINKELDRLRKTPPEQLKQEFIAEWTAQLEELTETASSENSKVFRKATKSSGNGKRLEFRLVADTPQELADEVEWPESNVDGYQWMKLKPQTDDNWHRNALCRQVGDDIYLLVSNKADETMLADGSWGLTNTSLTHDQMGNPAVSLHFDGPAQEKFYALTKNHLNRKLAICLDGQVNSAPNINTPIRSVAMITGSFTQQEAQALADALATGMPAVSQDEKPDTAAPKPIEAMSAFEKLNMTEAALPDEVRSIWQVLERFIHSGIDNDYEQYGKCVTSNMKNGQDGTFGDLVEIMRLNPDWKLSLLSVYWDAEAALAVTDRIHMGDSQIDGAQTMVFTLEKQNGDWLIWDVDLEELAGLQVENARFLKEHPGAGTWYIEPGRGAVSRQPGANSVVLLPSIREMLDLTTGKIVKVPIETKSQAECLAYAQQHCGCGVMFDHDGKMSHLGFINAAGVDRPTTTQSGIKMISFESANVPQAVVVTAEDGRQYSIRIRKAEHEGGQLEYEQVYLERPQGDGRAESMNNLRQLALAWHMYAEDNDGDLADTLDELKPYMKQDVYSWLTEHAVLLGIPGDLQSIRMPARVPIAYDKTFLAENGRRIVAFADGHVEIDSDDGLKDLLDEAIEVPSRVKRMHKLKYVGLEFWVWANKHQDTLPNSIEQVEFENEALKPWAKEHVEYLGAGKVLSDIEDTGKEVIAYDKTLLETHGGTNLLFVDGHVEFLKKKELKKHFEHVYDDMISSNNMLYGTVVDTEGDPVRGALVLPLPHGGDPVVTDDEGKFRLAGPSQDPNVDRRIDCLLVRDIPTNQAAIVKLESVKGPMRIRLQEALSVFGQVTDVDGSPVSDAKVDLSIHSTGWTAGFGNTNFNRTDSKGCFEIPALPHELEYTLYAKADGFKRFERRLGQFAKPGRFELSPISMQNETQVAIEARFLLVPDNFLEDIGLDVSGSTVDGVTSKGLGEIVVGPANSEEILAALEHKPLGERNDPPLETPGKVFTTLDERQCDFIIGARYAHRNSKTITAPKVMVLNGESACLQVVRDQRYTVGPEEFLDTETGMTFDIMPEISEDKKTVVLRGHIQLSDITETKTKTVAGQDYEMPVMQVTNIPIHQYALNDQQTLLIKGPEMTISKETHEESDVPIINQIFSSRSKVTDKQRLLIMIKPTVIEPQEVEPKPAIGVLAPESNNGHSGGMGGGFGGGFRPNNN